LWYYYTVALLRYVCECVGCDDSLTQTIPFIFV
jgi:hypothetical protein